jgi:uncharacterized protein DUF3810
MRRRVAWLVVALAFAGALMPFSPALVERWYSAGVYPTLQAVLTFASNAIPIALIDVLIAAVVILLAAITIRDARAAKPRVWLWRLGRRLIVWSAALYVAFLVLWGLNYRRLPLDRRLAFDAGAVSPRSAERLAATVVERLNALHARAHAEGFGGPGAIDPALAGAFDRTARALAQDRRIVAGRPKRSALDWYFRRAGVSGMIDPFFLETLVAGDLLPFERPFVIAHEWAHLAGLADEGEANLAGWLTCLQGSTAQQYSAWLFMYSEAMAALPRRDQVAIGGRLLAGPRDDLRAIRDRVVRNLSPRLAAAGWRVYDSYLKANRIEEGARSYDQVVRLALGLKIARDAVEGVARPF